MIKPLIDRFDFIFIFKDNRDKAILTEYAYKKSDMEDRPVPDYTPYIKKHIMYAKQHYPKPKFSEDAKIMLNEYFVNIRLKYGSPRIRETIYRIAENIARLKLKNVVDIVDAEETMKYYNFVLQQLDKIVAVSLSPRDTAYQECLNILKNANYAIAFDELKDTACKNKPQVARYIGKDPKLESNKKLRTTLDMLRNHSRVKAVQMRPVVLQYIRDVNEFTESTPETEDNTSDMVKACKQASDLNDLNDVTSGTPDKISCIHDENPIVISNLSTSDDSEAGNPSNISHTTESSCFSQHFNDSISQ
jgi:hypothetical protein